MRRRGTRGLGEVRCAHAYKDQERRGSEPKPTNEPKGRENLLRGVREKDRRSSVVNDRMEGTVRAFDRHERAFEAASASHRPAHLLVFPNSWRHAACQPSCALQAIAGPARLLRVDKRGRHRVQQNRTRKESTEKMWLCTSIITSPQATMWQTFKTAGVERIIISRRAHH
jgi:hypothetical protein